MIWENIKAAIGHSGAQQPLVPPNAPAPPGPRRRRSSLAIAADNSNVIQFSRQARRWRGIATAMTAIAAALIAMVTIGLYQPDLLPAALRPEPRTQMVEVKTPAAQRRHPRNTSRCCRKRAGRPRSS